MRGLGSSLLLTNSVPRVSYSVTVVENVVAAAHAAFASFMLLLLLPSLETLRDSESRQAPYRNEQYSRLLINFPILHGISVWEV